MTREAMLVAMLDALKVRQQKGEVVLVLCHFPKSFQSLQEYFEESALQFDIVTESIDAELIKEQGARTECPVLLSMAPMLSPQDQKLPRQSLPHIALVGAERHPLLKYDKAIEEWSKNIPYPVQLGYFLSLDGPLLSLMVEDKIKKMLEMFGMGQNELITSHMVSRRVDSWLKKSTNQVTSEKPADSLEEWLELNFEES